jgi:hypothetical protein
VTAEEEIQSMIKKWIYYTSIVSIVAFICFGFKPFDKHVHDWFVLNEDEEMLYHFPTQDRDQYVNLNIPFTGKFFIGYKEAIAFKESQGKYGKVNTKGYLGKYQFGAQTLRSIGVRNTAAFLRDPKLQEKAFVALLAKNKWELREEIEKYSGTIVGGVYVTESGILAAAHLGGVGSVKRFFRTNGTRNFKDAYGSTLRSFMRKFGGYETSAIPANANASVRN